MKNQEVRVPEADNLSQYRSFIRKNILIGLTNVSISVVALLLLPLLTKNLSIDDYGIWVQITVTIGLIPTIVCLGLPYTMVRFLSAEINRNEIQEGFYSLEFTLIISGGLTALIFILLLFINPLNIMSFFSSYFTVSIIVAIIIFCECINAILFNYFRTFQQLKRYSILTFSQVLFMFSFQIIVVYLKGGILGVVIAYLSSRILFLFIMQTMIIKEIGFRLPRFKRFREYMKFGVPTVPGNISSWIMESSDRYLIGLFLGLAFVGYYNPGYAIGNIVLMFMGPLNFLLPPILSKLYDTGKINEVKTHLRYSLKYFLLLSLPAAFSLSILSRQLLIFLSTSEIASHGYVVTPFTTFSMVCLGIHSIVVQILVLEKETKKLALIYFISAILNFIINLFLIPFIGLLGAAFSTFLAHVALLILSIYYANKYIKISVDYWMIVKILFACLVLLLFIIIYNPNSLLDIIVVIPIGLCLYLLIIILTRTVSKREIKLFMSLLK